MLTPQRLATPLALTALLAVGAMLYAGAQPANAGPRNIDFAGTAAQAPVQTVGYTNRYRRTYMPESFVKEPANRSYSSRHRGNGHDEIRELQRLFPETNWPPSMRYHQY